MARKLGDIGIDSMVGTQIKTTIENHTDVKVNMQGILDMKLVDIKTILKKANSKQTSSKAHKLKSDSFNKLPTSLKNMNVLITLKNKGLGEPIFIVLINDKNIASFQSLAKNLNQKVYALVWTKEAPAISMESMAQWFLKKIESITDGPFHLMGSSEGACIAFEMALRSERSHKKLKSLTLAKGSKHLIDTLGVMKTLKEESEVMALCSFTEQFVTVDISKLKEELNKDLKSDERIRIVFNYLSKSSSQVLDEHEVHEAATNHLIKHQLLKSYIPRGKLSSDIILLEDPSEFFESEVSIVKEILKQLCSGEVTIHRVPSSSLLSTEEVKQLSMIVKSII